MKRIAIPLCALALLASCASKKREASIPSVPSLQPALIGGKPSEALPRAAVYKMIGAATAANVPVQVDAEGNIISYPGPADVRGQEPIPLSNGYLLDRRGISSDSRFTRYTYAEYSSLKTAPTVAELKAAIIPDARVVDLRRLPMTPAEAEADTTAVMRLLSEIQK